MFLNRIHAEDRERVDKTLRRALEDGQLCSLECRTLVNQRDRWIGIEARRCSSGVTPTLAGVLMNITACKERALQRELLVRDLSHRISNAFSVLSAIVHLSGRAAKTADDLSAGLQERIRALARAYAVCPDNDDIALASIVERELAPFADLARVAVSGEPTWLAPRFAVSMTLILHELATNAMKHGALGKTDGSLSVRWWSQMDHRAACIVVHWKEQSSMPIAPPSRTGLGSTLLSMSARNVDGDICMDFQPDGLAATIVLPCDGTRRPA